MTSEGFEVNIFLQWASQVPAKPCARTLPEAAMCIKLTKTTTNYSVFLDRALSISTEAALVFVDSMVDHGSFKSVIHLLA